jgi:peptidoglycan/xylan/chitin deacetylase (PgdA/CDA1 family)
MKQRILQIIKSLLGSAEYVLRPWNYADDELLVLCMHSTPFDRKAQFEALLEFLFRHFKPLHPNQLKDYFDGKLKEGPYVLFTFDDGLKNNVMAAELLESRNAHAIFFVVPDFIDATDKEAYYRTKIRQNIDASIDHESEDFTPMSELELSRLLTSGHFVESHTMSHLLRSTSGDEAVTREVTSSKKWISEKLGKEATVFCSPIQTNFSVNAQAKRMIDREYEFHFTTFPGLHSVNRDSQMVFRRNIEVHWSMGQIKYALGKADLPRWKDEISRFQQL